jgi:hypothetical protein
MRRVAFGVLVLVVMPACATHGLAFREDNRVTIVRPADRALERPPITVEWRVHDFEVTGPTPTARPDAGYFAIFVDRAPQPAGRTVEWLFRDDNSCRPADGCPDQRYLADRDIYTTDETQFTIQNLRQIDPSNKRRRKELHEATIVLLDGRGRRIGESAFPAEFQVYEGGS